MSSHTTGVRSHVTFESVWENDYYLFIYGTSTFEYTKETSQNINNL